ncbi:MAG: hypothetical protein ABFR53_00805 [Actinomycetota bacterium]
MKKNWTKVALALGPVVMIATLAWEYARMKPDYNFLIQPWSLRGFEMTHGWVIAVLGLLLLIGGLLTSWEGSVKPAMSAAVTMYLVVAAVAFSAFFTTGTDRATTDITIKTVSGIIISALLAAVISLSLRSLLKDRSAVFNRALPVFAVLFIIISLVISTTIAGTLLSVQTWVLVLFVFLVMAGLSISIRPIDVAANRMMIFTTVAAWAVVVISAGAIRQNLVSAQAAFVQSNGVTGVSAQFKDVQAGGGWWLAGFGATIAWVGAIGLWAKRRDIVAALARARKQRAAAEESAREIQEAFEEYQREQAEAKS